MKRQMIVVVFSVLGVATPALSQPPEPQQTRPGNATPIQPTAINPTAIQPPGPRFQMANVRVELTVSDSVGATGPQKKTVSMMIADGQMGRIRAQRGGGGDPMLNVDATPVISGDRVRLEVRLEYLAPMLGASGTRLASISEIATVLLEPGKPMVISQSADPAVERKVTVEVTATILK